MSLWFRMYGDVINDPKVQRLPGEKFKAWVNLLCIASKHGGVLPSLADLSFMLRVGESELSATLDEFCRLGLIDSVEVEGAPMSYRPHNWDMRQYKSDTSTDRVRAFRNKPGNVSGNVERNVSCNDVGNVSETRPEQKQIQITEQTDSRSIEGDQPASAQIDLEEAIAAKKRAEPSRFDDFWQAFPRRDGPNPRKPAEIKFNTLVKSGCDPQIMIDAVKKLASEETARGNIGTRFIPQAVTWLNQQRWSDHAAVAFMAGEMHPEAILEKSVEMWAKTGRWSRWAQSPEPGHSGCTVSAELFAKYGLDPDGRKLVAA